MDDLPSFDPDFFDRVLTPTAAPLMRYHRYATEGVEHIPREGAALLLSTHSLITYDIFFAFIEIRRRVGRFVRSLADDFWFGLPGVAELFRRSGLVPASRGAAQALLAGGELLGVAPGGQKEALRPSTERFRLRWKGRRGFARLALEAQAPIVLVTCPSADLALTSYPNPLTDWVYRRFHWPLPIVRGVGPTVIPRPVRLTTHFAPPFLPPKVAGAEPTDEEAQAFAEELERRMERFVAEALRRDGLDDADAIEAIRRAEAPERPLFTGS